MSTKRAFDSGLPGDASQTLRPSSFNNGGNMDATKRSSMPETSMSFRVDEPAEDADVEDSFFLLKGVKYRNVQSLSDNSGEAQVFLVEQNGEKYGLKIQCCCYEIFT